MNEYNKIITKINNDEFFPIYILVGDENYFADIDLTSIDMHVFYKEQSYSLVVPLFPITTTRRSLDYIK